MVGSVRALEPQESSAYRELMLEAYTLHPDAFTSSPDERAALPLAWWENRIASDIVLGIFQDTRLQGAVGVQFDAREKVKHKCHLVGMYVRQSFRGVGMAQSLLQAAITQAQTRAELKLMQLTVTEGNVAAETLYTAHGFQRFGVEPLAVKVGQGFVQKVHMWKVLSE